MSSFKHLDDREDTLTTICFEKERGGVEEESSKSFQKRIEDDLGKYVDVKMKLDLALRKLEQK